MVEFGLFAGERIELLRGALVEMSPQKPAHASTTSALADALAKALGGRALVRQHSPLALSEDSEPEPDVAVVAPCDYTALHPKAALLVVEVADSSLSKDREVKAALYAEAGVPDYWIVNLVDGVLEVLRDPRQGRYAEVRSMAKSETVTPLAFPDAEISVGAFLR